MLKSGPEGEKARTGMQDAADYVMSGEMFNESTQIKGSELRRLVAEEIEGLIKERNRKPEMPAGELERIGNLPANVEPYHPPPVTDNPAEIDWEYYHLRLRKARETNPNIGYFAPDSPEFTMKDDMLSLMVPGAVMGGTLGAAYSQMAAAPRYDPDLRTFVNEPPRWSAKHPVATTAISAGTGALINYLIQKGLQTYRERNVNEWVDLSGKYLKQLIYEELIAMQKEAKQDE